MGIQKQKNLDHSHNHLQAVYIMMFHWYSILLVHDVYILNSIIIPPHPLIYPLATFMEMLR